MNAFDRFWQWANKSLDSPLAIPAELHYCGDALVKGGPRRSPQGQ
jgi:hypothetical protein